MVQRIFSEKTLPHHTIQCRKNTVRLPWIPSEEGIHLNEKRCGSSSVYLQDEKAAKHLWGNENRDATEEN